MDILFIATILIALAGLLWWWPLSLLAIIAGVSIRQDIFAIVFALLCDFIYGRPMYGFLHTIGFPFTAAALSLIALRFVIDSFVRRGE
ncbi:MAG TPA: hypothetical protein VF803_02200 [Candidatus Paceibacterota bacterium]